MPDVDVASPAPVSRQALWIGLILGGLFLVLAMTLGLVLFFALRKGPADSSPQASASASSGDSSSSSGDTNSTPPEQGAQEPEQTPARDPRLLPTNATTEPGQESWLPPEEQEKVNKAIDRGVQWLKKQQHQDGSWGPRVGLAALPALTLLECGVPSDDIRIQKAVHHVRKVIPSLGTTYDLALAILFLDRLSDPADKKHIQTCALRLAAGQTPAGGWTYTCPVLNAQQEQDLLTVMRERSITNGMDLFMSGPGAPTASMGLIGGGSGTPLEKPGQGDPSGGDSKLLPEGGSPPLDDGGGRLLTKDRPSPEEFKKSLNRLPVNLRNVPAVQVPGKTQRMPPSDGSDNSNTQFAILGMLAAGQHDLPLQRAYARIVQRFHASQMPNGHWNYHYSLAPRDVGGNPGGPETMTGAGLLGLAVQYGLAADHSRAKAKPGKADDPAVEKGFDFLARAVGKPFPRGRQRNRQLVPINFYLLWTIERCGVLFNRRQISGKDWYTWGVQLLTDNQQAAGSWQGGTEPGASPIVDTCFALLFLKRANLAKELTKKLEFFMEGKKLQGAP